MAGRRLLHWMSRSAILRVSSLSLCAFCGKGPCPILFVPLCTLFALTHPGPPSIEKRESPLQIINFDQIAHLYQFRAVSLAH